MSRIAIICATRGNPSGAMRLYESIVNTSDRADLYLCVDDDDMGYDGLSGDRLFVVKAPRSSVVACSNAAVEKIDSCDIFGFFPDDSAMTVPCWDKAVIEAVDRFPNRIGVVSASHNGGPRVNFFFVSREWINAVGWFVCPETNRFCFDTVAELLGEATAITYLDPAKCHVFHENPVNSVAANVFVKDVVQFFKWCIDDRPAHVAKLRAAMNRTERYV